MAARILRMLTILGLTVVAGLFPAHSASAAPPRCSDWGWVQSNTFPFRLVYPAATNTRNASGDCRLQQGDSGPGVFILQGAIKTCYGINLTIDAIYGPATALAVAYVQGQHGIPQDGIYGLQTNRAMRFVMKETHRTSDWYQCRTIVNFLQTWGGR